MPNHFLAVSSKVSSNQFRPSPFLITPKNRNQNHKETRYFCLRNPTISVPVMIIPSVEFLDAAASCNFRCQSQKLHNCQSHPKNTKRSPLCLTLFGTRNRGDEIRNHKITLILDFLSSFRFCVLCLPNWPPGFVSVERVQVTLTISTAETVRS